MLWLPQRGRRTSVTDANGNTLTRSAAGLTTSNGWDFENRLTSVTLPGAGGTVTFKYDPFGRRIQKSAGLAVTNYAYNGDNAIEELNATGLVTAQYTQGLGIDEPLAMYRSGVASFYHADGLGSIQALTDATGIPAAAYVYDSFGNLLASAGVTNPFRYTAREFDTETGLYYYRARYYDPAVGRFLSEDPIRNLAGSSNYYDYVSNGPTTSADPLGLASCKHPCNVSIPSVYDIRIAVDTMLGEISPESAAGTRAYQKGDVYGKPRGPVIADDDLDNEAYLIASTMVNRGNALYGSPRNGYHNLTLQEVVSSPGQYTAYEGNLDRLHDFETSSEGDPECQELHRAIDSLLKAANHPAHYLNYRAVRQPGRVLTRHWDHVVAGTSFF